MALPVVQFPIETFEQANPVMAGIGAANALYAQSVQNQYLKPMLQQQYQRGQMQNQILQPQAQYAPQMTQAELAYRQTQAPYARAQTQALLQGNIPLMNAQAGLIGTEGQKNQFMLNNPTTMLPGMAGQIGALNVLKTLDPSLFGSPNVAPPTQYQTTASDLSNGTPTQLPGMPSAGSVVGDQGQSSSSFLPPNPYNNFASPSPLMSNMGQQEMAQQQMPVNQGQQQPVEQPAFPSVQGLANLMMQGVTAPIQEKIAQANFYNQRAQGYNFSLLPPNEKSYVVAQAAGLGYEPLQATALLNSGKTISDLAQAKGLDPNNLPSPLYPASSQTVNLIQRRNQALNEINTIQPMLNNALAPYSRRFDGYSPSQIAGSISNDDPDAQARFLAAKALQPEMSSLRLKAMGGQVGIESIREVNNASMGNMKSFQGLVNPKVYSSAQNYVDQWINQGAQSANKVGLSGSLGNISQNQQSNQSPQSAAPITKQINGINYVNIGGRWHQQ
jgi:hypothetical protein